jgi:hypothetical protein
LLAIISFTLWLLKNNEMILLVFSSPTKVMSEAYPDGWAQGNTSTKVLTVLNEGDTALLIEKRTEKEFQTYKIKLNNGQIGFVFSGDSFHEQKKSK